MDNVNPSILQELRRYIFSVSYNIIGQIQEAEDIVQDSFEVVLKKHPVEINNLKTYLTRIAVNKSIDRLTQLKKERELYTGPWLPEPYVTPMDAEDTIDTLPLAILHLLEQLNPVERAVVILRESFDYPYSELALVCGTSEANCRQIFHRAKGKINIDLKKNTSISDTRLLRSFLEANITQDSVALKAILKDDIAVYSDGGGKVVAALNILKGLINSSRFLLGISRKKIPNWRGAVIAHLNGQPGIIIPSHNGIYLAAAFRIDDGKINAIYIVRNPEKLYHAGLSQKSLFADIGVEKKLHHANKNEHWQN